MSSQFEITVRVAMSDGEFYDDALVPRIVTASNLREALIKASQLDFAGWWEPEADPDREPWTPPPGLDPVRRPR
jgi:hypothetical protein